MITRILVLGLCLAGTASAQLNARLTVGYQPLSEAFDNDGDRDSIDRPVQETLVPVNIAADYTFFAGLYAGAELSLLYRDFPNYEVGGVEKDRGAFGISELDLKVGWGGSFVVDVGIEAGFKFDLGKHPGDLEEDKVTTSDNNHAFHIGGNVGFSVLPMLSLGARINLVLPLEREVRNAADIEEDRQSGTVVDAAATVGGSVGLGGVSLLYGVDLAFFYQGALRVNGDVAGQINGEDPTINMFHVIPMVGVGFGKHRVKLTLGAFGEDAMLGIPLFGKNISFATVPVSVTYGFAM